MCFTLFKNPLPLYNMSGRLRENGGGFVCFSLVTLLKSRQSIHT